MGFRIRKSFRVAPGMRINIGNRGIGGSIGRGGLRYTFGPRRRRSRRRASGGCCCGAPLALLPIVVPFRLAQLAWWRWWCGSERRRGEYGGQP